MQPRRVAVAVHDPLTLAELSSWITRARHKVVVQADSAEELSRGCERASLDLIIAEMQTPGFVEMSVVRDVSERYDVPVIVLADMLDERIVESVPGNRVFAHLTMPVRESELLGAIPLVFNRFQEFRALREETICMKRALEERKIIERAKGIIMRRQSLDEAGAFRHLQQTARNHRLKMADVAKSLVLAHEALEAPECFRPRSAFSNLRNESTRAQGT